MPRAAKRKAPNASGRKNVVRRTRSRRQPESAARTRPARQILPVWVQAAVLLTLVATLLYEVVRYVREPKPYTRIYRFPAAPATEAYEHPTPRNTFPFVDEAHRLLRLSQPEAWVLYHRQDWGGIQIDRNVQGRPLRVGANTFLHGIGTHANSELRLRFEKRTGRLSGRCGVDAAADRGSELRFRVESGGKTVFESGPVGLEDGARDFDVPVSGGEVLLVVTTPGAIEGRYADWTDLRFSP